MFVKFVVDAPFFKVGRRVFYFWLTGVGYATFPVVHHERRVIANKKLQFNMEYLNRIINYLNR